MRAAALIALALLTGCKAEPSFDERYEDAASEVQARANAINNAVDNPYALADADNATDTSDSK